MQFVALQGSYSSLEMGFFNEEVVLSSACYDELRASSNLVPLLEEFLNKNKSSLDKLSFIAVDKGPGAFTSLRATIASLNGIAFAKKIPLIGINSLEALQVQAVYYGSPKNTRYIIVLLNAYNNDVYYRIFDQDANIIIDESCQKIDTLVARLVGLSSPVLCVGNGVDLYLEIIKDGLRLNLNTLIPNPSVPSVKVIGDLARAVWIKDISCRDVFSVEPYYLKTQLFAIRR